ncbi:RteC domain-containing protein [uncultured Alistipes sp.]|uniref:RteC domain-containing protein n=1 Tax=uncultured Alistipes sp. TaxID=538949 RepID=UPI00272B179D|nr:RteC domain-containing protein [uncultured Alistipes sp.]
MKIDNTLRPRKCKRHSTVLCNIAKTVWRHLRIFRTCFLFTKYFLPIPCAKPGVRNLKKNRQILACVHEAAAFVSARIRIEEYRMQYPQADLFSGDESSPESGLYWNPQCGKRALVEILASLEKLTAFLDKSGAPSSFASIIAHFETLLHVELPRPYQIRTQIVERKLKRTEFIDKMKAVLMK